MSTITRRKLITTGIAAAAGASGLVVATELAKRYGLIPPDSGGIYGPGETLTYAAQRLLTRHSLAREFSRGQISAKPFTNEVDKLSDEFQRLQQGAFADWRVAVDGMVARRVSFSLAELKSFPQRSHITMIQLRKAGRTSPNGLACRSRTFWRWPGRCRKRATSCTVRSNRIGGRASTWPMRCIRKLC